MKKAFIVAGLSASLLAACKPGAQSGLEGAYANERTFVQRNENTFKVVGNSTIRDTIFLTKADAGYQVSNHRWKKNEYDNAGWKNLAHSENRPTPTYMAKYDVTLKTIIDVNNWFVPLKFDDKNQTLSKGETVYKKVESK